VDPRAVRALMTVTIAAFDVTLHRTLIPMIKRINCEHIEVLLAASHGSVIKSCDISPEPAGSDASFIYSIIYSRKSLGKADH